MAGASLLTVLDDIATVLDDVAIMTKVAVKKTAGVLGDDLALNAEQVSGVRAERELPVVWAVFKGSVINKLILVPAALAISALAPWLVAGVKRGDRGSCGQFGFSCCQRRFAIAWAKMSNSLIVCNAPRKHRVVFQVIFAHALS